MFMMNEKVISLRLCECTSVAYLCLLDDSGAERGHDRRFKSLSIGEDMDVGCDFGFGPSLTHGGWLYMHIGADTEFITMVGAKYV